MLASRWDASQGHPEEAEGEHFEVYEKALAKIEAADTQAA